MIKLNETLSKITVVADQIAEASDFYEVSFTEKEGNIEIKCDEVIIDINTQNEENRLAKYDVKTVLLYCISSIYENNIKPAKRYINSTKTVYKNKIGKLSRLMAANDGKIEPSMFNKVFTEYSNLTADLVVRYNNTSAKEDELYIYENIVNLYYETLNILCKDWKQEDIEEHIIENGYECKLNDSKDKIEVVIKDMETKELLGTVNIKVDNYSRKNNIMNIIRLKEQELKEQISA